MAGRLPNQMAKTTNAAAKANGKRYKLPSLSINRAYICLLASAVTTVRPFVLTTLTGQKIGAPDAKKALTFTEWLKPLLPVQTTGMARQSVKNTLPSDVTMRMRVTPRGVA